MRRLRFSVSILFLSLIQFTNCTAGEAFQILDRFDRAVQNERQGYRATFQRQPSRARILRVRTTRRGKAGRSMRIVAQRETKGFCGFWLHFFDMREAKPEFLDAKSFDYLSFWVKGEVGGEKFDVRLIDARWFRKEDSFKLSSIDEFLPQGVTTDWQEVVIHIRNYPLDREHLAGLTLDFSSPGTSRVYIDDVALKRTAATAVPTTQPTTPPATKPTVSRSATKQRAMWVWETRKLLTNSAERKRFLEFCKRQGIKQLWLQLPYRLQNAKSPTTNSPVVNLPTLCQIESVAALRKLLAEAHRQGLEVHALDGAPEFASKSQHHIPLAVIDAVLRFNQGGTREESFDGVHYDNEPYLMPGWHSPALRERMLAEYLELNVQCQEKCRRQKLKFGVDIPFWWQVQDAKSGEAVAAVTFRGVRKAASYHCLDLLDNVGVMDYRDAVDGMDGMIAHARDLIRYAETDHTKARLFIGVETFAEQPRRVIFVGGIRRDAFQSRLRRHSELANKSRWNGRRLRTLSGPQFIHLGLEVEKGIPERTLQPALRKLKAWLGQQSAQDRAAALEDARQAVAASGEWGPLEASAPASFVCHNRMLSKITFADDSYQHFVEQRQAAEDHFGRYRSFAGLAIHYYESFRQLAETKRD